MGGSKPSGGRSAGVLKDLGIYEGEAFLVWIRGLLEAKVIQTFGDLARREDGELKYRYKAQVTLRAAPASVSPSSIAVSLESVTTTHGFHSHRSTD